MTLEGVITVLRERTQRDGACSDCCSRKIGESAENKPDHHWPGCQVAAAIDYLETLIATTVDGFTLDDAKRLIAGGKGAG